MIASAHTCMAQDTGKFRQNTKDQFYTKQSIAQDCVDTILRICPQSREYIWIEPSAGNGSFIKVLPAHFPFVAIDLEPKHAQVLKADFLKWKPITESKKLYFGNPPFGSQGSLAKAFIKHAASNEAQIIAFILPRSFMKPSMSCAFPKDFHCIHEKELPKDSFEVNAQAYDVPCVFQIWQKRDMNRNIEEKLKEVGFQYVKGTEQYHMAFRRVGGTAGTCYRAPGVFTIQSHYFLKLDDKYVPHIEKIMEAVNKHVFPSNTVGPRSLSKGEANVVINQILLLIA